MIRWTNKKGTSCFVCIGKMYKHLSVDDVVNGSKDTFKILSYEDYKKLKLDETVAQ
jgi:hypothetical protein